jgi:hypothetical protein
LKKLIQLIIENIDTSGQTSKSKFANTSIFQSLVNKSSAGLLLGNNSAIADPEANSKSFFQNSSIAAGVFKIL